MTKGQIRAFVDCLKADAQNVLLEYAITTHEYRRGDVSVDQWRLNDILQRQDAITLCKNHLQDARAIIKTLNKTALGKLTLKESQHLHRYENILADALGRKTNDAETLTMLFLKDDNHPINRKRKLRVTAFVRQIERWFVMVEANLLKATALAEDDVRAVEEAMSKLLDELRGIIEKALG